jgi:Protein of unknown function (DUF3105)
VASKKKKRPTPPPRPVSKPPRPAGRSRGPSNREQALAAAKARKREALRRRLVIGALLLAALAAVGAYVLSERRSEDSLRQALTSGSCEVDTESDAISGGDGHVAAPVYEVDPPAGGDHLASVARGGVYEGDGVPPDGELVHALEHGYVVAWHRPDLPEAQQELLAQYEQRHDGDVIVAERATLPVAVAATAWGQRLLCGEVEPDALDRFAEEHVGGGPEGGVVDRG